MESGRGGVGGDAVAQDPVSLHSRASPDSDWRVVGSVMGILAVAFQTKKKRQGNS